MKRIQLKDKMGIIWYAHVPDDDNIKVGDKLNGQNSPTGKAIGKVEVIKIEGKYYDVSGH